MTEEILDRAEAAPVGDTAPRIPVSWGELIDRLTILEIKNERMENAPALANVRRTLAALAQVAERALAIEEIAALKSRLREINESLWDVENRIRGKEAAQLFDAEFIALARSVYQRNDERSALKRAIDARLGSVIREEKSYATPHDPSAPRSR